MPSPQSILANLTLVANEAIPVAIAWHGIIVAVIVAMLLGWRPSRRRAGALLAAPVASAGIIGVAYGNPFNGVVLSALAVALVGIASRLGSEKTKRGSATATAIGVSMVAFGWLYPHFLESHPAATYLFAAPAGVIPCPTLSLVIGFALLSGGLGGRAWSVVLAAAGLFYGLFGVVRLGVGLDIVLVGGSAGLLVTALRMRSRRTHRVHRSIKRLIETEGR